MVLLLTGFKCAGKTSLANYLVEYGYKKLEFRDAVVAEANRRGLNPEQLSVLQTLGRQGIAEGGEDYWARVLIEQMQPGNKYVVVGNRYPKEIDAIKTIPKSFLIGVYATDHLRMERMFLRAQPCDPTTPQGFKEMDERDRGINGNNSGQRSEECFNLADLIIPNNGTLDELQKKAGLLLNLFG